MGEGQLPENAREKAGLGLIPFSLCLLGTLCVIVAGYFHGHMTLVPCGTICITLIDYES